MDRYLIQKKILIPKLEDSSSSSIKSQHNEGHVNVASSNEDEDDVVAVKRARTESFCESTCEFSIIGDPALQKSINEYDPCPMYVHCLAHELQLVIMAVSQKNQLVSDFFEYLSAITKMVGASCKRKDEFRQRQHEEMVERLESCEITKGRRKNQESALAWSGSTRWGSHCTTIVRILSLWNLTLKVLDNIFDDGTDEKTRGTAGSLAEKMESYGFIFIAHLMHKVLAVTDMLSICLQQKEININVVAGLVHSGKLKFQDLRDNGWDKLIGEVNDFCTKHNVVILDMDHLATNRRSRRNGNGTTNYHHLKDEIFCQVMDQINTEMENRFSEPTLELLSCIGCLDPKNMFSTFCERKLLQLAKLYPQNFSICEQMELKEQLQLWICEMRKSEDYSTLQNIGDLSKKMVEKGIHKLFHLVYRLIELTLLLPVATCHNYGRKSILCDEYNQDRFAQQDGR